MKITSKSDYGLMVLIALAQLNDDEVMPLGKIAERHHLSLSYLEQIALNLKKKNLIKSKQGANGGYFLAKEKGNISIKEIIQACGDEFFTVKCSDGSSCICDKKNFCNAKTAWIKVESTLNQAFQNIKLIDILN